MSASPYPDSPHGSDWSTASHAGRKSRRAALDDTQRSTTSTNYGQLSVREEFKKPERSRLRQQILTEDEYTTGLSEVIKRSFFPQLREFEARDDLIRAVQSEDPDAIEESARRMREVVTPTPRRRARASATPGRTPFGTEPSDTPTYFSETPSRFDSPRAGSSSSNPTTRYDPTLSLDAYQATYTSEDNSSFIDILAKDNDARKERFKWAYDAERKANQKAIRGREARERLVELTREMVESDPDGVVRMIEGAPGRPGARKLVVGKGALGGEGSTLMVEAGEGTGGRLLITDGGEAGIVAEGDKGKGRAVEGEFVDWEKATADEEEENRGPKASEIEIPMEGHKFTNRNSLMFAPDANGSVQQLHPTAGGPVQPGTVLGEPKGVRYHATRMEEVERKASKSTGAGALSSAASATSGYPSPTRSRINAAITDHQPPSATPKVAGFSFVDALPTPRASTIDPHSLQELMTWGTIESTPRASSSRSALSSGGGPFRIADTSQREVLAHKMAQKAKRSLAAREEKGKGSKSASSSSSSSRHNLRRSVLESSSRRTKGDLEFSPVSGRGGAGGPASPRSGVDLSPAAKLLLKKTGGGGGNGMSSSVGWKESEDRDKARARARERARELESQDRLKRARWTPSPAPSTGFTP